MRKLQTPQEIELQALLGHDYDEVQYSRPSSYDSTYTFIATAGHGFLAVPKGDTHYTLAKRICSYGYKGKLAIYLEEDCEMSKFLTAIGTKGFTVAVSA